MFLLLALAAGSLMPVQAGINTRLKDHLGDPVWAALVSFFVGTVALAVLGIAARPTFLGWARVAQVPWWAWTGGVLGAFFVASTIVLAQKLGAASMLAWLIAGQLTASLIIDQYGLVNYAVREVSWPRILGAVLLFAGAVLVEKY